MKKAIQFAVVREDPELEAQIIKRLNARSVLLVASGGCSALALKASNPELKITLVDANPAQLELVARKIVALRTLQGRERELAFNIESDDPGALNACGNFESLFRELRSFWREFIFGDERILEAFSRGETCELLNEAKQNKYWPVSFDLFFSDSLLNAMFGPEATRHAVKGSYPAYFRSALEGGLSRPGSADNRFLQHIFLGYYLCPSAPTYFKAPVGQDYTFETIMSPIDGIQSFSDYDVISLSNIFDWTDRADVASIAARIGREMKPGACVLFRQLNNDTDFQSLFGPNITFDLEMGKELLRNDQSLFYSKINVGIWGR